MSDVFSLPVVSRTEFRQRLAGLIDPGRAVQEVEREAFRQLASDVVVSMCLVFNDSLDRKTLWSRIDSGLQASCAKVDDGDADRWIDLLLEHVKADASRVVRLGLLRGVRESLRSRDSSHRRAFIRWVESHRYAVLTHGRAAWEDWKRVNKDAAAEAGIASKAAGGTPEENKRAAAMASYATDDSRLDQDAPTPDLFAEGGSDE